MEPLVGDQIQRKPTQKFAEGHEPAFRTTITNIYLNEVEYRILEALGGSEILKYRYVFDFQGHQFGIDRFDGRHEEALKQLAIPPFAVRRKG